MSARGCEQYRDLFEKYDWAVETMLAICRLESGGLATASNWKDSHATCNGSHGLMQVGCVHGHSVEELYDPAKNIAIAYSVYKEQGFSAWRNTYNKLLAYSN